MPERERRWNGWGFAGETFAVSGELGAWLERRLGRGAPMGVAPEAEIVLAAPGVLPGLACELATDDATRLRHAAGMSFPDLVALRHGAVTAPDGVVFPTAAAEVVEVLQKAAAEGIGVVVRGGGSSVVGGVTVRPGRRSLVLSLQRLHGLVRLDPVSMLATFGAGTYGPEVEAALAGHGLRLGHEPQSFEHSTIGGWVAARSAGQRSTGIGKIEDLVAGLEIATSDGVWRLEARPAAATGPDLLQAVVGSEGRLGVISEVTVRVRPVAEAESGVTVLMPSWSGGVEVARRLLQRDVAVEVLRLSDRTESEMALAVLHLPAVARRTMHWLTHRRRWSGSCLLLLGWSGEPAAVLEAERDARGVWRELGGFSLGGRGYRSWRRDRFRHPYLRDALLDAGWGIDTLETAAPWSILPQVYEAVRSALAAAAAGASMRCVVLCHLSHAYRDGASLYFTFVWPLAEGEGSGRWQQLKVAATDAMRAAGGTLSHHHGVGSMHAPWLAGEVGATGERLLRAMARAVDPGGVLNRGTLLEEDEC